MHTYSDTVVWKTEKKGIVKIEGEPDLEIAPPPEFGGPGGVHAPEDLFVASLNGCIMATFLAFAEKTRTKFNSFESTAHGSLDKVEGKLKFTKIDVTVNVTVPSEREKKHAEHTLKLVNKHCLITNSLNFPVELDPTIIVE
ncbi:MAG: OsmC family protein [Candidatus Methanofastidiosia archaeon]|jgi:organic hydroperoxide reductase OsmC/OhrA